MTREGPDNQDIETRRNAKLPLSTGNPLGDRGKKEQNLEFYFIFFLYNKEWAFSLWRRIGTEEV